MLRPLWPLRATGLEHLPRSGPAIPASDHLSVPVAVIGADRVLPPGGRGRPSRPATTNAPLQKGNITVRSR